MSKFISLSDDQQKLYEKELPKYVPVERACKSAARYEKVAEGNYRYIGTTPNEATVACVGDMLCEAKLYQSHVRGNSCYFHNLFQFVQPIFAGSDLVIGNLETTICPSSPYTGEQYKVAGKYHCNAPMEFLEAIKAAGFDCLTMANNHCCDSGVNGLLETIHNVEEMGIVRTGAFTPADTKRYVITEVNGIRIAVLSYSTWFNRNEGRFTKLGQEQLLSIYSQTRLETDVRNAKEDGAEFVMVYMHWGIDAEYKSQPSRSMRKMAEEVANAGVDYIIGSHTHSLQPYEMIHTKDGRDVPCIFSMGNFVTSELSSVSRNTAILQIKLRKVEGKVSVVKETLTPCYIPDSAFGLEYPILTPAVTSVSADRMAYYKKVFGQIEATVAMEQHSDRILTAKSICDILGVPNTFGNQEYTTIEYAIDAKPGCVALIWQSAFDPYIPTTPGRCVELADLAMKKGAKLLLSNTQIKDYPCLVVEGYPFDAFTKIVAAIRRQFTGITVGVTGSIGKTSTTGMVDAVLGYKYKTFGNLHNANSARWSAKLIQQLNENVEVYVQETMETPPYGLAGMISRMVQPEIAIVTVVGTSHMKALGSQERILETCMSIQKGMPENGLLILNGDDPFQCKAVPQRKAVYYAIDNPKADYRAENIRGEDDKLLFDIIHDGIRTPAALYCFGRHNVLNALASFAAAKAAGMTDVEAVEGLKRFRTEGIRQNMIKYGSYRIFMDCYNAAAESMGSAMEALGTMAVGKDGRRIAVLADIKETGEQNDDIHRTVGQLVAKSKVDMLFCYGESAKIIADTARGLTDIPIYHTLDDADLEQRLRETITPADVTLFKGSRGMALERFVDRIFGTWFYESDEDALAQTHNKTVDGIVYRVFPDHAVVTAKQTKEENVVLADSVDGVAVTGIDRSVFTRSTSYTRTVRLPAGLQNVRYCAFYKVSRLESVHVPASVRIIDASAFSTCERMKEATIEEGCIHLGYRAFGNCVNLEKITIPASVRQIGGEAFINCKKLTIYGIKGSYAETYAKQNKISFKAI